jgi:hypothetical protein
LFFSCFTLFYSLPSRLYMIQGFVHSHFMRPMIVRRAASCKQNLLYDNFKILSHLISGSLNLMTIMNHNELYARLNRTIWCLYLIWVGLWLKYFQVKYHNLKKNYSINNFLFHNLRCFGIGMCMRNDKVSLGRSATIFNWDIHFQTANAKRAWISIENFEISLTRC